MNYAVGDRVQILRLDIRALENRKRPVYGRIIACNGSYITVQPSWSSWLIELYPNEIKRAR